MKLKIFTLSLLFLTFSLTTTIGQPICKVRTFGTENGLPASIVSGMTQSTDGLIWLTTWNGLSCFDGYRFTTFRNIPGRDSHLTTNHLVSVMPASNGDLWTTAYSEDVYLFDSRHCQYVNVSTMITKKFGCKFSLRKIYPLSNGDTWFVGKYNDHYCMKKGDAGDGRNLSQHSLPGTLNKVVLDAHGGEWLLCDQGAFLATTGDKPKMVCPMWVDFVEEQNGRQWLVTTDGRLLHKSPDKDRCTEVELTCKLGHVNDVKPVGRNILAMATENGLFLYNTKTRTGRMVSVQWPGNAQKDVSTMFVDSKGRVWCFNDGSDVTLVSEAGNRVLHLPALTNGSAYTLADKPIFNEDAHHTIWVAPKDGSFSWFNEAEGRLEPQSLESTTMGGGVIPRVKKGYSDRQGNLWLVFPHNLSLVSFSYSDVKHLDTGIKRDTRSVMQDHNGNILLGMVDGEVIKYSAKGELIGYLAPNGTWTKQKSTFSHHIYALHEDRNGNLWIGTKGKGLYCVSKGKVTRLTHDEKDSYSLISDDVYDIKELPDGRFLVACFGGGLNISESVYQYSGKLEDLRFLHGKNVLRGYDYDTFGKMRRIEILPDGNVLLSTTQGLLTFSSHFVHPDRIRFYLSRHTQSAKSLYSSEVMQTLRAGDGTIYVVTLGGGLQRIASKRLLQDNLEFEPVHNGGNNGMTQPYGYGTIQSLASDAEGNVWVMGESRMACIGKKGIKEYGADELGGANITEAMPSFTIPFTANNKEPMGHITNCIVVATEGGAFAFDPRQMNRSSYTPNIVFTSLRYMDRDDEQPILNMPELNVDVDHRSFTLFFSALDYESHTGLSSLNENCAIRYAYRIDDGNWTYVHPGSNSVSFNHFPAGSHTVSVKSTNGDGVWMNNERQLHLYAEPTFTESWWGRTIIALAVCAIIIIIVRTYMKRRAAQITDEATEKAEAGKVRFMLRKPEIVDEDKVFMDDLLAYIEQHINDTELKVDDMAAALSMGRSTFYARLKQIAEMSPNDFLRHVRMKRAEDLVADSQMPFSQIAYAVGFSDPKYFGKCFKKHTGFSPSEYRRNRNNQSEDESLVQS